MVGVRAVWGEVGGVLRLAVPIVAGLAASTLITVADSVMLAPLGAVPLAAVGLTGAAAGLLYSAIYGLLSALSVRIGAAWGAGEARRIPLILRNGLVLGLAIGIGAAGVMAAIWPLLARMGQPAEVLEVMPGYWALIALYMVPYAVLTVFKSAFEAVDRPWTGTVFAFMAVALNVPLNAVFIYGFGPVPALGLTGAGIASVLAETAALMAALAYWRWAYATRRLRLRRDIARVEIAATLREGAPLGLLYVVESGSVTVATMMVGAFGTVALAANQVAMAVGGVLYMVPVGVAGAVAIRVAQARGVGGGAGGGGAGGTESLRAVVRAALVLVTGWLVLSALALALAGRWVAALMVTEPEVISMAAAIMVIFALFQVIDGVQSTMQGALRGLSDTAWPAMVSVLAYWVLSLPLGYGLGHWGGMGAPGIWTGFMLGLVVAAGALIWRFRRQMALLEARAGV